MAQGITAAVLGVLLCGSGCAQSHWTDVLPPSKCTDLVRSMTCVQFIESSYRAEDMFRSMVVVDSELNGAIHEILTASQRDREAVQSICQEWRNGRGGAP